MLISLAKRCFLVAYGRARGKNMKLRRSNTTKIASNFGIPASQIDRMASAFDYSELKKGLSAKPIAAAKPRKKNQR